MSLWQLRSKCFFFAICLPPAEQRAADRTRPQYPAGSHLGHAHGVRRDHWTLVLLSRARRNSCLATGWPRKVFLPTQRKNTLFICYPTRGGGVIHLRGLTAWGGRLAQTLQNKTSNCVHVFLTQQLWVHLSLGWPGLWHVPGPRGGPHHPDLGPEEAGGGPTGEIRGGQEFETGHRRPSKGWPPTH